jgi:hypothetical protein
MLKEKSINYVPNFLFNYLLKADRMTTASIVGSGMISNYLDFNAINIKLSENRSQRTIA